MLYWNNGYTEAEAYKALTSANPKWRFPVALLDNQNRFIRWLKTVLKGTGDTDIDNTRDTITQWQAQIIEPYDYHIDPYSHRFQSFAFLRMKQPAATGDGTPYLKYPQGVFIPAGFTRSRTTSKRWRLDIQGDDQTYILGYGCPEPYSVIANGVFTYTDAIKALMLAARFSATQLVVEPHAGIISTTKDYEADTPWITILRDLVKPINFEWFFDQMGNFIARKWIDPNLRTPAWHFIPDGRSIVYTEMEEDEGAGLATPNFVFGTVSRQTNEGPIILTARAINDNELSRFSTRRRGFVIPHKVTLADAPDQPTFQEQVDRVLAEFGFAIKTTTLRTGLVPFIGPMEVITARTEDGAIELGEFEADGQIEGWTSANVTGLKSEGGALKGKSTTADPQLIKQVTLTGGNDFAGNLYRYVKVVLKVRGGGGHTCQLFFTTTEAGGFDDGKSVRKQIVADGEFHEHWFDMWTSPLWKPGRITQIRLDPLEATGRYFEVAQIRVVKHENRFLIEKLNYGLNKGAKAEHTVRLTTVTG